MIAFASSGSVVDKTKTFGISPAFSSLLGYLACWSPRSQWKGLVPEPELLLYHHGYDYYSLAFFHQELNENHHTEVGDLRAKIKDHLSTIRCLQGDVKRRDSELTVLRQRARLLDEVMRYKASLAKLTITLEQAEQYSRAMAGRNGLHGSGDPRLAVGGVGAMCVYTEPAPREGTVTTSYIVDEMPDEQLMDRVGEASVKSAAKLNGKPTLAEKAAMSTNAFVT